MGEHFMDYQPGAPRRCRLWRRVLSSLVFTGWVHNVIVHGVGFLLLGWCAQGRALWDRAHDTHARRCFS